MSVNAVAAVVPSTAPSRETSYALTASSSVLACHASSTRPGLVAAAAVRADGAVGGSASGVVTVAGADASPRLPATSIARTAYVYVVLPPTATVVQLVVELVPTQVPLR